MQQFVEHNAFSPELVARALRTTKSEVAETLGLTRDSLSRAERARGQKTQTRLREMIEILNRVETQTGSMIAAYAWYRSEPLPGFGGQTAQNLVQDGKASQVHACLDAILAGSYA